MPVLLSKIGINGGNKDTSIKTPSKVFKVMKQL